MLSLVLKMSSAAFLPSFSSECDTLITASSGSGKSPGKFSGNPSDAAPAAGWAEACSVAAGADVADGWTEAAASSVAAGADG
ncbi:hypothetical protein D3C85_1818520 [compost metagenome]